MKKLFGAKKVEEPKPQAASLQDTSAKVNLNISIKYEILT